VCESIKIDFSPLIAESENIATADKAQITLARRFFGVCGEEKVK
jgi:hypothetical protein